MTSQQTSKRIVVLGAGYTGMMAALATARRTRHRSAQVTLVNPSARFTERLRMHQVATGQRLANFQIPDLIAGTGITFVLGRAERLDPAAREVVVTGADGPARLGYDFLIYAIGSATDTAAVPGVAAHAYTLNSPGTAAQLAHHLDALPAGAAVAVCGNGLTGIEAATEIAESHPELRVLLLGRDAPGKMMGPKARAYLERTLRRLRVEVRSGVEVTKVLPDAVELADGELVGCSACLWTTGFWASPLAADAGLAVDERGRIAVDAALRSVSHPSVFAVGDSAAIRQGWGVIHGTCQSGMPSAAHAAANVARLLTGKQPRPFRFGYIHQPVSLGRRDAVIQFTKPDDSPRRWYLTGRQAIWYKKLVTGSPPVTYRMSRRVNVPAAALGAKGGRGTRHPALPVPAISQPGRSA